MPPRLTIGYYGVEIRTANVLFLGSDLEHPYLDPIKQAQLKLSLESGSKTDQPLKKKVVTKTRYRYDRAMLLQMVGVEYGLIEIVRGRFKEGVAKEYILFRFPHVDVIVSNLKGNAIFWFYREKPGDDHFAILAKSKIKAEVAGAGSIWCTPGWQDQMRKILSYCPDHLAILRYQTSRFWPQTNMDLFRVRHPQLALVLDF